VGFCIIMKAMTGQTGEGEGKVNEPGRARIQAWESMYKHDFAFAHR